MSDAGGLYMPDTPEGRAIELCAAAISRDASDKSLLPMTKKLARIALEAMVRLAGAEASATYFAKLSRDALEMRGRGRGRTGAF